MNKALLKAFKAQKTQKEKSFINAEEFENLISDTFEAASAALVPQVEDE